MCFDICISLARDLMPRLQLLGFFASETVIEIARHIRLVQVEDYNNIKRYMFTDENIFSLCNYTFEWK